MKCPICRKSHLGKRSDPLVCCGSTLLPAPPKKQNEFQEWLAHARITCNSCPHYTDANGKVECELSPTRPCDLGYHQRVGRGCFAETPRYKPGTIRGWKEFRQPSLDDHCVAVTALSKLPHHRARQAACLDSWKAFGLTAIAVNRSDEIAELRSVYPQVDQWVQCDSPLTDYTWHTQRIHDLANVAIELDRTILVINSDIEIYGDQSKIIEPLSRGEQIVGIRWNYREGDIKNATREPMGLDAFSFTPAQAEQLPDLPLRIGRPMWDYWIPTQSRSVGQPMRFIGDRLFFHVAHPVHWSQADWKQGERWVCDHYGVAEGHFGKEFRSSLPFPPDDESSQRSLSPRPITVLTSPRTGSNLLVDSLAQHPDARSASEWFGRWVAPEFDANRRAGMDRCNVFKLFSAERGRDGFDQIVDRSFCVFLYRHDRVAQLASWRKACKTGQWTREAPGPSMPFPGDAEQQIIDAAVHFPPIADLVISYEDMITNWDSTIERLLSEAGWDPEQLPMARQKL